MPGAMRRKLNPRRRRSLPRPRSGKQADNPSQGRSTRIAADERGHFIAKARLNGRPVDVLVDTGATLVAINESTARRIGLKLSAADFKYKVNTANGQTMAAQLPSSTRSRSAASSLATCRRAC